MAGRLSTKGDNAFKGSGRKPTDANDKMARLERENIKLKEAVEILKKAAVYSARELK